MTNNIPSRRLEPGTCWRKRLTLAVIGNALIAVFLGAYLFLIPAGVMLHDLADPGLKNGDIPRFTFRWHQQLTPKVAAWAEERVASGKAGTLNINNISGTEWPIFSSVYYLWATEALQQAWEADPSLAETAPVDYAHDAIEAATALIVDPNHAAWVKQHWGDNYLYYENIFYRMLYSSGLTSYQTLTGNTQYEAALRTQIDDLAQDLDDSRYGLLDDYPDQCYPIDILPAIAVIQRADALLGTDHSAEIDRASRGFEDARLDPVTGLPSYIADSFTGEGKGPSRGVGISYMLIWLPELWPDMAADWYPRYEQFYWQQSGLTAGIREFARGSRLPNWYLLDVDAGPVIAGYGTAASAFGIGATRTNGRMDHAWPMSAEAIVAAWPLADGTLLTGRLLSNLSDAPYLGESALLFIFTRTPLTENITPAEGNLPKVVTFGIGFYLFCGMAIIFPAVWRVRTWLTQEFDDSDIPAPGVQMVGWLLLVGLGVVALVNGRLLIALVCVLVARFLPRRSGETVQYYGVE